MSELSAQLDMPLGPQAVAAARHAVEPVLRAWGYEDPDWLYDAGVVVSELVSNAVRHGGGCLALEVRADADAVTVAVADGSAVVPRRGDGTGVGGRGVAIIEAFSQQWGVEDGGEGKRVWVRLQPYPRGAPAAG